jgi:hypothetical protein
MSTLALPATRAGLRLPALPVAWIVVGLAVAVSLVLRELSVDAFVAWNTAGFVVLCVRSFTGRGRLDACDVLALFTLYYAMAMLVRGIGLLTWVESPYLTELGDARSAHFRALVGWAQFHSALGLFAVQEGYRSPVSLGWARTIARRVPLLSRPWRTSRVTAVAVTLGLLGIAGAVLRAGGVSGFLRMAANPLSAITEDALGQWWKIALTEFAVVGYHLHLMRLLLRGDPRFLRHYLVLGLALCGPVYLMGSSKTFLLRTLLVPWLLRNFVVSRTPLWKVLVAFAAFSALFPFFYAYRRLGLFNLDVMSLAVQNDPDALFHVFNRAYGTDSLMLVLHRTGVTVPFQWGATLTDLFTFWIPRAFWAHKPDSFGLQFPALFMPDMHWGAMTYASASLPGELFLDFHVFGVIGGCWLLGAAMRTSRFLTQAGPGGILVYCYSVIIAMHLVEGCIAVQLEYFLILLVPSVLGLLALTAPLRRTRAPGIAS